ncbi:SIMPL domain-containing protein [Zoogloea sp. LCSB751]|uniref:SIMPL domain-containing protein n=1 Tax=Zoogloea sp. LCSB751 TaxID=1965277 RepID=UPI0009A47C0D|nr:SIMPL domain-containing protein [Zoogloea sp. LCSB751]
MRIAIFVSSSLALLLSATGVHAANGASPPALPTADISVEASRPAPNDQFRAQVYYETTETSPGELSRKVNTVITQALQTARSYPAVKVRTGGNLTYPVYGKNVRNIEAWRMRSSLTLEAQDSAALSELLGKLQQSMVISGLNAAPSSETWKKIEDQAIVDALAAFEARAKLVATGLNKKWKIKHVSINSGGIQQKPIMPLARSASLMAAEAVAAPIEAGDSTVSVSVNGQIELLE